MIIFNTNLQEEYQQNDVILDILKSITQRNDTRFTSHRWLLESLPKRMIYYYMYHDLLEATSKPRKVLDIGGGYTALTRLLLQYHHYLLLDTMVHDNHGLLKDLQASLGQNFWINSDWYEFNASGYYDLIIANDLFPNVDQRLAIFLNKYLPRCNEIRLSLTYYNEPRWYKVKRTDADEVFHIMAWDGIQIKRILEKYIEWIQEPKFDLFLQNIPSLFANNRQVCLVTFQGGLSL